ncbi:hypothetical protein KCP75_25530 [Salmonella enterica subsp. enterica]|nr:hypothetical protein KCP75_25530 [Salmonella enterica subsp. enterica]
MSGISTLSANVRRARYRSDNIGVTLGITVASRKLGGDAGLVSTENAAGAGRLIKIAAPQ